jgi:hypothetical protein
VAAVTTQNPNSLTVMNQRNRRISLSRPPDKCRVNCGGLRAPSGLASGLALAVRPAGLAEAPGSTARRRRVPRSGFELAKRGHPGITVEAGTYQIAVEPGITITAPRTTSRDIKRHNASNYKLG